MNSIQQKKTKIVATIGPASRNKKVLSNMAHAGLNVVRMNFSHGSHEDHFETLAIVRKVIKRTKKPLAILQDLSGPKIRLGTMEEDVVVAKDDTFILTTKKCLGTATKAFVNYKKLPSELSKGSVVKIDDGKLELVVSKISKEEI